jgi:hypothetical protein
MFLEGLVVAVSTYGGRRISPQELDRNVTTTYSTSSAHFHWILSHARVDRGQTYTKESDAADDSGVLGRGKSVIGGADNTLGSTAGSRLNNDALRGHCDEFEIGFAWRFLGTW